MKQSQHNFQVNLGGIIDILSNHLYSEESTFIRELLQNSSDAITLRKKLDASFKKGKVHIESLPGSNTVVFEDNGVGLTEEEIHKFLTNIGASIKRNTEERDTDFIGQFGIGLLSCFMVTDEITMITSSVKENTSFKWTGKSDGTYHLEKLEENHQSGTKVYLKLKEDKDEYADETLLKEYVVHYGNYLEIPVFIGSETSAVNLQKFPFKANSAEKLLQVGTSELELDFLDAFEINTTQTKGACFIYPSEKHISSKPCHRAYLKNMLISENAFNIAPDWAVFIQIVINTSELKPTASREGFYENDNLELVREKIGKKIVQYLIELNRTHPEKMQKIVRIHGQSLKLLALENDAFFNEVFPIFTFPTSMGEMNITDYLATQTEVLHVPDIDEFRQLSAVAAAEETAVINSGYTYDYRLLEKYGELNQDTLVKVVSTADFVEQFGNLSTVEEDLTEEFLKIAKQTLAEFSCTVEIKKFSPDHLPALYYASEEAFTFRSIEQSKEVSNDSWNQILGSMQNHLESEGWARFIFNFNNPLILDLLGSSNDKKTALAIQVLYVQSLMLGHHPISQKEQEILNKGLSKLIRFSIQ